MTVSWGTLEKDQKRLGACQAETWSGGRSRPLLFSVSRLDYSCSENKGGSC